MKHFLCIVAFLLAYMSVLSQELVPFTDSSKHFTIMVPQWSDLPQDLKSNIRLYLYDSSSAMECTAQTYLILKVSTTKKFTGKRTYQPHVSADSSKGVLANGAQWHVYSDSVICRPGEKDYKIQKQFVNIVCRKNNLVIELTGTAIDMKSMLPTFLEIAKSIKYE